MIEFFICKFSSKCYLQKCSWDHQRSLVGPRTSGAFRWWLSGTRRPSFAMVCLRWTCDQAAVTTAAATTTNCWASWESEEFTTILDFSPRGIDHPCLALSSGGSVRTAGGSCERLSTSSGAAGTRRRPGSVENIWEDDVAENHESVHRTVNDPKMMKRSI